MLHNKVTENNMLRTEKAGLVFLLRLLQTVLYPNFLLDNLLEKNIEARYSRKITM